MSNVIRKVGVIGAGVMGAGIAAQVANAGVDVVLLDVVPDGARQAVARLLKSDPPAFMHPAFARRVMPGSIDEDFALLEDCDWIIEVVVEDIEVKRDLYARLEARRRPGSIVSSNTSTMPLSVLTEGMPESFRADFCITHFFNPPRYMRLLELVTGPETRPEAVASLRHFIDVAMGKSVIDCKDTPGFIANRIGVYWMMAGLIEAVESGVAIEDADAVVGPPMGIPKSGVFGLLDLIGIDLMPKVVASMVEHLPSTDMLHGALRPVPLVDRMIADGLVGRKAKAGFYRVDTIGGKRVKQAMDLVSGQYREQRPAVVESARAARTGGLRAVVSHPDDGGRYAWRVLSGTLCYAATLAADIADDIVSIDEAMRLGYNWRFGPFELIDQLGAAWFIERLEAEGRSVPDLLRLACGTPFYRTENGRLQHFGFDGSYHDVVRPEGVLLLADVKSRGEAVATNASASLWDIGDGVACLEFHTKMNAIDDGILSMVEGVVSIVEGRFKALVIYNEGDSFSAGANLRDVLLMANAGAYDDLDAMLRRGQKAYGALRSASFPVVGAPAGIALGGGCEVLLHCDSIQAYAETYVGLVETGVGLVPAWGGCKEMLRRCAASPDLPKGPLPPATKAFEIIMPGRASRSAAEARDALILGPDDGITMNRDRLLADAKAKALSLIAGYRPPEPAEIVLPGQSGKTALVSLLGDQRRLEKATPHDVTVGTALADIVTGGATDPIRWLSEDDLLALERWNFLALLREPATIARIEAMLTTGRPLRN